jgi:hypothetical protein
MFLAIVCHTLLCSRDRSRLSVAAIDDSTSVSLSHVYLSRKWVPIMPAQYAVTTWVTKNTGK